VEVASEAAAEAERRLGVTVHEARFESADPEELGGPYDVVTMWYVIEHFEQLGAVLSRAAGLVRAGGVFAFSTPNMKGISGRIAARRFLENSPGDHYTVWHPRSARKVLSRYGLRVSRVRVTGHHPERFPGCGNLRRGGLLYRTLRGLSRLLRLGDTFEVYATMEEWSVG
jgi:hypothetical protein